MKKAIFALAVLATSVVAASASSGRVVVFSGLKAGETVVEEGAILLDNQIALAQ